MKLNFLGLNISNGQPRAQFFGLMPTPIFTQRRDMIAKKILEVAKKFPAEGRKLLSELKNK